MRLLMFDNEFPPLGGGTAVVNRHLLDEMAHYPDVHVDLITSSLTRRQREEVRYAERIRVFKVPVHNRDLHHSTHVEMMRYSARGLRLAMRLLERQRYDASFAFSGLPAGALSAAVRLRHGLPYVVSLQGRDVPGFDAGYSHLYPLFTPIIREVWKRAAVVVAISADHRRLALRTMPDLAVRVVHNGVDTDLFHPAAGDPAMPRPLTFVCVGRLVERKGHRHLLEAFAEVRRRCGVPLALVIAGQGEIEGALRERASRLGIADAVRFLGYVPHDRVPEVYRGADVFVLASQNEGMSIAVLEAMASSLPVVVTRAGGTAELVDDGVSGIIVRWADVAGLADALARLVTDESLRRGMAAASRRRSQEFSWPAITRQYLDLCEEAARQKAVDTSAVGKIRPRRLRICILASQYFAWGKYGGFGSMARKLATSLAASGHEVSVLVPRRGEQPAREIVDGVCVDSFPPAAIGQAARLLRDSRADIFHSQDPTVLTWLAQKIHPARAHLVTCRDPRDLRDWRIEFALASSARRLLTPFNYLTESGALARRGVRGADAVYCPAHFLRAKVDRLFRPRRAPTYLPNLIDVPPESPRKSEKPTFVFLARWDRRKRPEKFLELAARFPEHRFVAVGQGEDAAYDGELRRRYGHLDNLEIPGFVDRFREADRLAPLLEEAWVLVNTAAREGLPLTFLEAAAHGCAILSGVDPDGFASRFGVHVCDDDFAGGVARILAADPLGRGAAARAHVRETCETSIALAAHLAEYRRFAG